MQLPILTNLDVKGKCVIVRIDSDVPVHEGKVVDTARLELSLPTLNQLLDQGAQKILLLGHMGRPQGKMVPELSLKATIPFFKERITTDITFIEYQPFDLYFEVQEQILDAKSRIILLENLRFWPQEEQNDKTFAEQLSYGQEFYVNESFASSHRAHASIVSISNYLPSAAGLQFTKEVDNLSRVFNSPPKPVIALISGAKKDKIEYIDAFLKFCDKILVAGRLPEFMPEDVQDHRILVGRLIPDKEDITLHSIEAFEEEISKAGTIIFCGPPSRYEDPGHKLGTERVLLAISKSRALKIAGGGDTLYAIHTFHLEKSFDWISSGGGATLDFLAKGSLPGIEALLQKVKT